MKRLLMAVVAVVLLASSCAEIQNSKNTSSVTDRINEATSVVNEAISEANESTETFIAIESSENESQENTAVEENPCFDSIELYSEYAFLYNSASEITCSKGDLTDRIYPASITKLYTAYIALKYLNPQTVITAGDELNLLQPDSSIAFIQKGHRLTVEMLVEGMLLPSGNDSAYILARAVGEKLLEESSLTTAADCVAAFVEEMNICAQKDELSQTNFTNPDGYHHPNHYTSMKDLLKMAKIVLECDMIIKYTGLYRDNVYYESGQSREWINTNLLLNPSSRFYRQDVIGLKTGYTAAAGHCLLTVYKQKSQYIVIGVFRSNSSEQRFEDTLKILDFGLKNQQ